MKVCENFVISLAKLQRNSGGWISSRDWNAFFHLMQIRADVKYIEEEPFGFLGSFFGRKVYIVTFSDNTKVRMWRWKQVENIIDTPCAWVRYRVVCEILKGGV